MHRTTFHATLKSATALSSNVKELCFERTDGAPILFQAGQWVNIVVPRPEGYVSRTNAEERELKRAYSIASPPLGNTSFSLAVTHVDGGPGSSFLHTLKPGENIEVYEPQGFFTRTEKHPSLFVGTGTGVTPLRSMILDALARGDESPMHLLFGVRTEADCIYRAEFESLAKQHSSLSVEYTLSRPSEIWSGSRHYVQTHVDRAYKNLQIKSNQAEVHVYICGLQKMVSEVRDLLRTEMKLPRGLVHSERYD